MKKAIVVAVMVILAAALSIPFASGLIMEKTFRGAVHDVNSIYAATGTGYSLEIINYDRGYLTSDIEWKIDPGALKSFYRVEEIVFKDRAEHGFAGVVSTTSLERNPWYAAFVAEKLQGRDPVHITTRYGLSGSIESRIALDAFSVVGEDGKVDVKSGSMVMAVNSKLKRFSSFGDWEGLSVGETMAIGKTSVASNLRMFSPYIWDGDIRFEVQRINAREKEDRFELEGMKGRYLLQVNDDRSTTSWEALFSIDGMNARDVAVGSASARLAINGLNVKGYEACMQMYTQAMSQVLGRIAALDQDSEQAGQALKQQMSAIGFQLMAAYEKLLKQGLEFKISDLHVKLADGEINGGITLRLLKDMTFMQFIPIASQPDLLFDILYLKSDFSLPISLVGEAPKLVTPMYPGMRTGLFVVHGASLVHRAETIDGKFILNGVEVLFPGQKGIQPSSAHSRASGLEHL